MWPGDPEPDGDWLLNAGWIIAIVIVLSLTCPKAWAEGLSRSGAGPKRSSTYTTAQVKRMMAQAYQAGKSAKVEACSQGELRESRYNP